jgi:hypothetical protein
MKRRPAEPDLRLHQLNAWWSGGFMRVLGLWKGNRPTHPAARDQYKQGIRDGRRCRSLTQESAA